MGHDAFYLVDAIPSIDDKVTAVSHCGDFLYLGTASGKLLQYRLTPRTTAGGKTEYSSTKERSVEIGSSKASVLQVETVPELNVLVALCDGAVSLHRLLNLDKVPSVLDAKNAASFAVNASAKRLCVVSTKRRLRLYEWIDGKFAPTRGHPELDVPDVPRACAYYGSRICVGYQREYNVIVEDTGDVKDVSGSMSRDTRPCIKVLPGDQVMVVCAGEHGVVLTASGDPAPSKSIVQFGHKPTALGYCYPYVLSIGDNSSKVEVHATRGGRDEIVQTVTLPGVALAMTDGRPGGGSRSETDGSEGGKGRNPVFVAFSTGGSSSKVCRLQSVPVDRQVSDMLRQYQVIAAGELLTNTCPDPQQLSDKLARLNIDAGRSLFFGLHFEQAWPFLSASAVDPREVLQMFPELLPGSTTALPIVDGRPVAGGAHSGAGRASRLASVMPGGLSSPSGSSGAVLTGGMYQPYGSRYFSVSLTQGIATGVKQPQEAASEAADARGGEMASADLSLAELGLDGLDGAGSSSSAAQRSGKGKASGRDAEVTARIAVADLTSIISSQHSSYHKRMKASDEDPSVGDSRVGVQVPQLAPRGALEADGRLLVAYRGLLHFLRKRRAAVLQVLRDMGHDSHDGHGAGVYGDGEDDDGAEYHNQYANDDDEEQQDEYDEDGRMYRGGGGQGRAASSRNLTSGGAGAVAGARAANVDDQLAAAGLALPSHTVTVQRGRRRGFHAPGSAFTSSLQKYSPSELGALASVLDTALFKLFVALGRSAHADRMAYTSNRLYTADIAAFCRDADLSGSTHLHSLALLYAGRGMSRECLAVWRDLGTGVASEDVRVPVEWGSAAIGSGSASARRDSQLSDIAEDDSDDDGPSGSGSGPGAGGRRNRSDSLSEFGDVLELADRLVEDGLLSGRDEDVPAPHHRELSGGGHESGSSGGGGKPGQGVPLALALARSRLAAGMGPRGPSGGSGLALHDGIPESVSYLRGISEPVPVIFEYSEWLLLKQPVRSMAIFTDPTRPKALKIEPVLEYLSGPRFAEAAKRNPSGGVLRMYLEHLVGDPSSRPVRGDERHHTRLAREYIATVTALRTAGGIGSSIGADSSSLAARLALEGADRRVAGSEGGLLGRLRGRLVRLLQESPLYDAQSILALLKDSSLLEERVILHGRLEQHDAALALLVGRLGDHDAAVRYCSASAAVAGDPLQASLNPPRQGSQSSSKDKASAATADDGTRGKAGAGAEAGVPQSTDPFLVLLRSYLEQHKQAVGEAGKSSSGVISGGSSAYLASALELLSTHPGHVDAVEALRALPADLPARALLQYARNVLPGSTHAVRESTLARHLYKYSYISSRAALVDRQRRSVTITRNSSCPVCNKRLGDAVFALLPDGRPVHFYCQRDVASLRGGQGGKGTSGQPEANAGFKAGQTATSSSLPAALFHLYPVPDVSGRDSTGAGPLAVQGLPVQGALLAAMGRGDSGAAASTAPTAASAPRPAFASRNPWGGPEQLDPDVDPDVTLGFAMDASSIVRTVVSSSGSAGGQRGGGGAGGVSAADGRGKVSSNGKGVIDLHEADEGYY